MSHLDEGLLHALLDGEVPSTELPPIQAHLAGCAECRERLEQERGLLSEADAMVELLEVPAAPAPQRGRGGAGAQRWGLRLAWAASVLAALGLGYAVRPVATPPATVVAVAPAPVPPAPAPAAESARVLANPAPAPNQPKATVRENRAPRRQQAPLDLAAAPAATASRDSAAKLTARLEEAVVTGSRGDSASAARAMPPSAGAASADRPAPQLLGRVRDAGGFAQLKSALPAAPAPAEPIGLADAVRRLGGSLRLVDGLVPLRLEAQGQTVRVVYALTQGELVLSQQLIDGKLVVQLIAPAGFPADSLAKLRARVRE